MIKPYPETIISFTYEIIRNFYLQITRKPLPIISRNDGSSLELRMSLAVRSEEVTPGQRFFQPGLMTMK
jgi:hypothetical protein